MRDDLPSLDAIAQILGGKINNGQILAPGPGHSAGDSSLSFTIDKDAPLGFLVHSFGRSTDAECLAYVRAKLGLKANGKSGASWTLQGEWVYRDAAEQPYLRVRRYLDDKGTKQYPQQHWEAGQWVKGKPSGPKIPYRLPELMKAPAGATVFIVEGEKCADALAKLGFIATTQSEGAKAAWQLAGSYFKDRRIVILPDADKPGREHAQKIANALLRVAASIKIVDLFPDDADGSDVIEWLESDSSGARLVKKIENTPEYELIEKDDLGEDGGADTADRVVARPKKKAAPLPHVIVSRARRF